MQLPKSATFVGSKVHMVVTCDGMPIEMHFKPESISDVNILWEMELDIPENLVIYAGGAYNCFDLEDILAKEGMRRASKEKEISSRRQIIETAFSHITNLFPRHLKARTEAGFILKVICVVLAYSNLFAMQKVCSS